MTEHVNLILLCNSSGCKSNSFFFILFFFFFFFSVLQFRSNLSEQELTTLIQTMILMLQWKAREVVKSSLAFVKVAIATVEPASLEPHLPALVTALFACKDETKHSFRSKIKALLERLIRKFGLEAA